MLRSLARLMAFARRDFSIVRSMVVMQFSLKSCLTTCIISHNPFTHNIFSLLKSFPRVDRACPTPGVPHPRERNIPLHVPPPTIQAHASPGYCGAGAAAERDERLHPSKCTRSHASPPHTAPTIDAT